MSCPFLFYSILYICLIRLCYTDIKAKELEHLFIFLILICAPFWDVPFPSRIAGAMLPFFIYKFLAKGDIYLLSVLGFVFGTKGIIQIYIYASLASGILCLIFLLLNKIKRDDEIPFAPYIAFGCTIYIVNTGLENIISS